ncbi:MAG: helix-turn-helix domain-containing protein [Candidatus Thorarchaeota archaeon]
MGKEYTHLSKQERDMIYVYKAEGLTPAEIAEKIGRNRSTIRRKLKRNAPPVYKGYYLSRKAQERVEKRMSTTHTRQRLKNQRIRDYVGEKIKELWSPEIDVLWVL